MLSFFFQIAWKIQNLFLLLRLIKKKRTDATFRAEYIARRADTFGPGWIWKINRRQANAVRHVLYPSLKDMGCFTIFVVSGIPEPNQASIRRSRTVSFSRSSHPDEQSMILKRWQYIWNFQKDFLFLPSETMEKRLHKILHWRAAVSYTHLTLPTILRV